MPTELERTAHHEAGHYVAHYVGQDEGHLGGALSVSIVPNDKEGSLGRIRAQECPRSSETGDWPKRETIEAHVVACCAGFAAQRRFDPSEDETQARGGAANDFELAKEWDDVFSIDDGLRCASALVTTHWRSIEVVAKGLLARGQLNAEEADALLILTNDSDSKAAGLLVFLGWAPEELTAVTGKEFTTTNQR